MCDATEKYYFLLMREYLLSNEINPSLHFMCCTNAKYETTIKANFQAAM
jgi:hypothetical protein